MTIEEYFKLWENFDYYTFMSDDFSVGRRGIMQKSRLLEQAGDDPILIEIHTKFCDHDSSLGRDPMPKLEDYTVGSEE